MSELITFTYWFNPYGAYFSTFTFWFLLTTLSISALAGIYLLVVREKKTKHNGLLRNIYTTILHWLNSLGFVGLILFAFRHYRVPYFGMRVWLILWLLICLVWLLVIVKYLLIEVPKKKKEFEEKSKINKYI